MDSRLKGLWKRVRKEALPAGTQKARPKKPRAYEPGSTESLYEAVDFLRATALDGINRELVRQIRDEVGSGRPLTVGFLVNDRAKWNSDSLLEEMRASGWSTRLFLSRGNLGRVKPDERISAYQTEREYFAKIDPELVDVYSWKEDRDVPVEDVVKADVVFYQQPWAMKDFPRRLAGRSLGAYMHYGFMLMANHGMHYHVPTFHPYLWRYFTQTEEHRLLHLQHDPSAYDRLVVTGYPKLDVYLTEDNGRPPSIWPSGDDSAVRVVYAPHHSLGADNLEMSTFAWNYDLMLNLAKTAPNVQWVYKPHPNLRYSVVRNKLMTRAEYTRYEGEWAALPNATVYDGGSYFDIFRSSDALITDSGSFLAEYLPTGKPIIWLVSATSVGFNSVGHALSRAFYKARSVVEIREVFQTVIMKQQDPLKEVRAEASLRLFPAPGRAASAVVSHLREQLATDPGS